MKRRVDEIQTFHSAARPSGTTAIHHRITTSPQNSITSPNANPNQYHILNVLKDQPGAMVAPAANIQYTYTHTPSAIVNATSIQKNNVTQAAPSQVHVVNATSVNLTNSVRPKPASGAVTPTPHSSVSTSPGGAGSAPANAQNVSGQNFPRLKVEDALSYLDQVKYKFGNQPQVYNDFLDIMKEFKSQSIDTPGVIQRVSNLFKGHPELIVGFNTFLPPGYKIEVQANDQGFAYQVSVSVPSPSGNSIHLTTIDSPLSQLQIIQGSSHIIQQPTVNLITHTSHPQNLHVQQQPQPASQDQRTVQTPQITTINLAQNYSRDRERTLSAPGVNAGIQPNQQTPTGQQSQPAAAKVQQQAANQPSAINDSGINRMQQQVFATDNQPVQFNQAIVYVNKIKCRFQEQPEKYKDFLRILHKYQNEQRKKEGKGGSPITESEVFKQVASLFDNQEDLLREFGQFLPDATPAANAALLGVKNNVGAGHNDANDKLGAVLAGQQLGLKQISNTPRVLTTMDLYQATANDKEFHMPSFGHLGNQKDANRNHMTPSNTKYGGMSGTTATLKRSPGMQINHLNRSHDRNEPPMKRHKATYRDVSFAEAARSGTLQDFALFDKLKELMRSADVFDNFLRCLVLYNQDLLNKSELMKLVTPFLSKNPELLKRFQDFLKFSSTTPEAIPLSVAQRQEHRTQTDTAAEIDVTQCKRLGTSYCALPKTSEPKKCSGRTSLCRTVLNDQWVSFPSWSEDSTFNTSRKTQYEEFIYRCEDERFELDVVIETNSATIRVLEGVQKKMSKMSPDELGRFKLDDFLGGTSQTIHQRALRRIYGDKANDIIEGLKKNPNTAVPVVLRRLKAKEEEWREAQKGYNQQWREQNEKYYLKSLDHQGINFKHTDTKALRSKSLMNQIETIYEERNEGHNGEAIPGPHLVLSYKDKTILDDAANLLIHHVKRQTGIQKQEKARIKHILRQFIPGLFFAPRQPLSDDEREDVDDKESNSSGDGKAKTSMTVTASNISNNSSSKNVNSIFIDSTTTDKANSTSKTLTPFTANTPNSEQTVTNCTKSVDSASDPATKANNCDSNDVMMNSVIDTSGIKLEIKDDPDAPKVTKSINNIQPALGGSLLPPHAATAKHPDEEYTLFYGNSNWYYFLRLHAILCERLRTMYDRTQTLSAEEEKYKTTRRESAAIALRLKPQNEYEISEYYSAFLEMLKSLLDGNMDATTYDDKLRDMYGIHAYIAFTLDRVVSNAVRQIQFCVTERNALECFELYQNESRNHATGGMCSSASKRAAAELSYQRRAEGLLQEDTTYFKIFIYKVDCRVTIEMLENDTEDTSTTNFEQGQATSKYVDRYTNPALGGASGRINSRNNSHNGTPFGTDIEIKTEKPDDDSAPDIRKPLFLSRNIRKFNRRNSTSSLAKLLINENGDVAPSKTSTTTISTTAAVIATSSTVQITANNEAATQQIVSTIASTTTTCTLTTSSSGVPPPLIIPKLQDPLWNKRPPERVGQSNSFGDCFVDDQQQVRLNYNNYKSVFLTKGYILYRSNSLKRAKQTHPKVTLAMDQRFDAFVQKWHVKNVTEVQRISINDWLSGLNQTDLVPNKTTIKKDNSLQETPYRVYNRYRVEYPTAMDTTTT